MIVPDLVDPFPGDRQQRRVLLHDGFGLMDQLQTPGGIDFTVNPRGQRLELRIVPERVVLRAVLAVPGAERVGGIEQAPDDGPDRSATSTRRRTQHAGSTASTVCCGS